MRYSIVIEKAEENYAAYVPDLPGCIATAETLEEVKTAIREAMVMHLELLQASGAPIPQAATLVDYIETEDMVVADG